MTTSAIEALLPGPIGAPVAATDESSVASEAADFESFLTLLTAQLRNQDPLAPLDSTEFVAQLANFSSVEQQIQTNDKLDALAERGLNDGIADLASWIDRDIVATDGSFRATGDPVQFRLPPITGAQRVEARIVSEDGNVINVIPVSTEAEGPQTWDGRSASGTVVTDRDLRIELAVYREGVVSETVPAQVARQVTGIRGTAAGPLLELSDGGTLSPDLIGRLSAKSPEVADS